MAAGSQRRVTQTLFVASEEGIDKIRWRETFYNVKEIKQVKANRQSMSTGHINSDSFNKYRLIFNFKIEH
jgi:hypothetical protein